MAKNKKDDDEPQDETTSDGSIAVNDAWTGMLAVSLLALAVGSGFLLWDYLQYDDAPKNIPSYAPKAPGGVVAKPDAGGEKKVEEKDKDKDKEKAKDKDARRCEPLPDSYCRADRRIDVDRFPFHAGGKDVS